jgi:hypothetical protein
MKQPEPEPEHSPTSIAKEYGSANLYFSWFSAQSLEEGFTIYFAL